MSEPDEEPAQQAPHEIEAERRVLSAMMDDPRAVEIAVGMLEEADFYRPGHQVIFRALFVAMNMGLPLDPVVVGDLIVRDGDLGALGGRPHEYLFSLFELRIVWSSIRPYAEIVRDRAVRRRTEQAGIRIQQWARSQPDLDELAAQVVAEVDGAVTFAGELSANATQLQAGRAFMASTSAKPSTLIPGVLNAQDRVVVVGGAGSGKTTLAFQVGVCGAIGRHPFAPKHQHDPLRVLIIDFEMPAYLLQRNLQLVLDAAEFYGDPFENDRLQIIHRPRGIDLNERGQAHLLAGMIRKADPQIIVAGPVYKMHADSGERGEHTGVMDFWDDVRDRLSCALWLETHPAKSRFGKTVWEPSGSGRWRDWPEIGFAMVPVTGKDGVMEVRHFRGMRDRDRAWPEQFSRAIGAGLPWQATYPVSTFSEQDAA